MYDAVYPFMKGGGERRFYELGRQLSARGYDVHLYSMKAWPGPAVMQRDGLTYHGLGKDRPIYLEGGRRSISQALLFGLSAFRLLREDFDVIDCCGFPYFSLFPAKLAATVRRKPLFSTWHEVWGRDYWNEYLGRLGPVGYAVERLASKLPASIIAVSKHTAQQLESDLDVTRPIVIVANGIDGPRPVRAKDTSAVTDMIYVGRLMNFKNVHLILEALALLKAAGRVLTCTILGDGPESAHLRRLAVERGVDGQVTWLPFQEDVAEVYAQMESARMLVLPSQREGFGIVAIEANACGIPVLTLDHPNNAARDLIEQEVNGSLFDGTGSSLAAAIESVLDVPAEAWRDRCRAFAHRFEWSMLAGEVARAYGLEPPA